MHKGPLLFITLLCVCMYEGVCGVCTHGVRRTTCKHEFSFSNIRMMGLKLRASVLATGPFSWYVISLAPCSFPNNAKVLGPQSLCSPELGHFWFCLEDCGTPCEERNTFQNHTGSGKSEVRHSGLRDCFSLLALMPETTEKGYTIKQ